jgi:hypothetical protein
LAISPLIAKEDPRIGDWRSSLGSWIEHAMVGELTKFLQSLRKYPAIPRGREGGRHAMNLNARAGMAVIEIDASFEKRALPVTVVTGFLRREKQHSQTASCVRWVARGRAVARLWSDQRRRRIDLKRRGRRHQPHHQVPARRTLRNRLVEARFGDVPLKILGPYKGAAATTSKGPPGRCRGSGNASFRLADRMLTAVKAAEMRFEPMN